MTDDAVVEQTGRPVLRVVRGQPSTTDLAVIAAAIAAAGSASSDVPADAPRSWGAYWREVRQPLPTGAGAWRASARPR